MLKIKQDPTFLPMNKDQSLYVTLKKIRIETIIRSLTANVTITQVFRNNQSTSIETVYYFPVEKQDNYTVTVHINGIDTLKQNNSVIDIGSLAPSEECIITVTYTSKLRYIHESMIQFVVPSNKNSEQPQMNPYTVEFICLIEEFDELKQKQQIIQVNSTSHPIQVQYTEQKIYIATFNQQNTYLNKDILINIC